jgi:hypothetical protein
MEQTITKLENKWILHDTKKMFEYYEQYKSIREQADNF